MRGNDSLEAAATETGPVSPSASAAPPVNAEANQTVPLESAPAETAAEIKQEPEAQPSTVSCLKCSLDKLAEECVKKNRKFPCKLCNTATAALSRALGG